MSKRHIQVDKNYKGDHLKGKRGPVSYGAHISTTAINGGRPRLDKGADHGFAIYSKNVVYTRFPKWILNDDAHFLLPLASRLDA